jgi:hypothetical protein
MSTATQTTEQEVSHMPKTFAKRTFTVPLLLRSFVALVLYMPVRWFALVKPALGCELPFTFLSQAPFIF